MNQDTIFHFNTAIFHLLLLKFVETIESLTNHSTLITHCLWMNFSQLIQDTILANFSALSQLYQWGMCCIWHLGDSLGGLLKVMFVRLSGSCIGLIMVLESLLGLHLKSCIFMPLFFLWHKVPLLLQHSIFSVCMYKWIGQESHCQVCHFTLGNGNGCNARKPNQKPNANRKVFRQRGIKRDKDISLCAKQTCYQS